jgi:hypothetical protein
MSERIKPASMFEAVSKIPPPFPEYGEAGATHCKNDEPLIVRDPPVVPPSITPASAPPALPTAPTLQPVKVHPSIVTEAAGVAALVTEMQLPFPGVREIDVKLQLVIVQPANAPSDITAVSSIAMKAQLQEVMENVPSLTTKKDAVKEVDRAEAVTEQSSSDIWPLLVSVISEALYRLM